MTEELKNTRHRDSSSKIIFEDPILCAQFLRGYLNIPLLKDVQPEDIEDVTERYVHMFVEERDSDVVKRVRLGGEKTPFYMVSLIEHKSNVDYNVVMQIFRYMAFIWEDYEKEAEKQTPGISRTKGFRYPPILPVVFYDGKENWTAATGLHERVLLSDVLGRYIPDYQCLLMQLKDYSTAELMEKKDELSVLMMVTKLQKAADFSEIGREVSPAYLEEIFSGSPEYLLDIVARVVEALLTKLNVPDEESAEFAGRIKERHMGRLFENFEGYDVQEVRRQTREEVWKEARKEVQEVQKEAREEAVKKTVQMIRGIGLPEETAVSQLMKYYDLTEAQAREAVKLHW